MYHNEFDFIEQIKRKFSNHHNLSQLGIGDDCAVIPYNQDKVYLVSTDTLIENIHFRLDDIPLNALGWKSVAVSLSDIVAMGGSPKYIFISIACPKNRLKDSLMDFYQGVERIVEKYHVDLLGGDTSLSLRDLFISVTAIGTAKKNQVLFRSQAKPEDFLYVTGTLGDSALACSLILKKKTIPYELFQKHYYPEPKIKALQYLQLRYCIHSAIDLSDGLSGDLGHIVNQSNVQAFLVWSSIPVSDIFMETFKKEKNYTLEKELKKKENYILHGGEDYEILFSSPEKIDLEEFKKTVGIQLTQIGYLKNKQEITNKQEKSKKGIFLIRNDFIEKLDPRSYNHFQ